MGKPRLILIIRHAQSEGNKDKNIHQSVPDHRVPLTAEGHQQAREAGEKLRALLRNDDTLHFFISPYRRTRETTEGILSTLCSNESAPSPFQRSHVKVYEEPRLREQDFGNFQPGTEETERLWRERAAYGHFFYRIPNGESGADVYDRVSSFNGSLWRRFNEDSMASVAVLVTHGLCSRVFLMAWYHYSVEFFEDLRNINHVEFLVMKLGRNGRYVLQNQLRRWSDLKRERAQRKSISQASPPPVLDNSIPVRRWGSTRAAYEFGDSRRSIRPKRQNTIDLFSDEDESKPATIQEESESTQGLDADPPSDKGGADQEKKSPIDRQVSEASSARLATSLNDLSLAQKSRMVRSQTQSYLGRDGGGTRSGAASPFAGSDDEEGSANDTPPTKGSEIAVSDPSSPSRLAPRSMGQALRGEFDDPNRVMADALGDQSDAEVDEADKEMGTKDRERIEMAQILAEERRERTHRGNIY